MTIDDLLNIEPYSVNKTEKAKLFSSYLTDLSAYHYSNCEPYRKILNCIEFDVNKNHIYTDLPFLPVQLFKTAKLISTPGEKKNVKILSSSGSTGQNKTQVYLDPDNAVNQSRVLAKIISSFIGSKRMPMIIIDSEHIINDRTYLSARAAGIIGFSLLGSKRIYILNEDMELNVELLQDFIDQHRGESIFLFGFTFMIFEYFYRKLIKHGIKPDLSNAVLIHGGGWKKLEKVLVSETDFRNKLNEVCGIQRVYNYYGMAEQTGSIFMQCEFGNYHASVFSDIIIRRAADFSIADVGEEGIIQVLSLLPKSYPGHSLLTDDKGILLGEDNCRCRRLGKYFKVSGRLQQADLRGCSDSYE